ncbi:helix-turn-helix domain-containing protein [Siminovitchia sp. 179-K 8D1 HS]|uniref:helix-turn-helix domain-containing protein n=1 Tax=Siminovitchia sp. 179-K 8D1 HS TaxID=3142385 RepID=UPI0039A27CCC
MKTFNDLRGELAQKNPELFIAMEIVGKIMAARDRQGISQRKLSEMSGVPQKTISRIENGIDVPKISTLIKLTTALGLEFSVVEKETADEQSATLNY